MGMKVRSMSSKKVERRAWGEGERWGVWVAKKSWSIETGVRERVGECR